jgi:hypothetical protein
MTTADRFLKAATGLMVLAIFVFAFAINWH